VLRNYILSYSILYSLVYLKSVFLIIANFREWRHIIELRGSINSQWEIRNVVIAILKELKKHAPTVFSDFIINENNNSISKIKLVE